VSLALARRHGAAITAAALVLLDVLLRVALGDPYAGATVLLLAACGTVLLPFLPRELARPALRLAALPALALGSFTILVTTLATLGFSLTETSIRATVALFVAACTALDLRRRRPEAPPRDAPAREAAAVAAVLALALFAFASSWDVVGPFPPRGTDWGHYFLYADEVERQGGLLIDDPLAGEADQVFADPPMVGALYGGVRVLDGVSSRSLGSGVAIASAFSTLALVAAAGGLWGIGAGLAAGALYSVAPIRIDPMYWHGLGTTLALVFLPFVILALGLIFRGRRDPTAVGLLGVSLVCVAAAHTTTAVVAALVVAAALVLDAVRAAVLRRDDGTGFLRRWWRHGAVGPLLAGSAVAAVLGSAVAVHLLRQSDELGDPIDYRFFDPDWLTWSTLDEYLSTEFLVLASFGLLVVLGLRRSRRDAALLAVAALVLASIAASQLWRLEIPYEYRRAVYPFGVALVLLLAAAAARISRWAIVAPLGVVVCAYFAHEAIGLRLPERLLSDRVPTSSAPAVLDSVRMRIERGELPDTRLVVADQCLHFIVPYLLERPTISAFEDWQVAFETRLPAARLAATILAGGPEARKLATELGAGYVVADPRCTPRAAPGLGGTPIEQRDDVVVIRLPAA
jgi:hypothetical protein